MLTNYNGTAITYDAIGNPLRWRNGANVEWYGRQMTLFAVTNGGVTSYVYNSDGVRTQKIHYDENAEYVGVTKYTLDGNKIVAENRLGVNIYYTYDDKGAIMGMIYGEHSYVFSKNLQGDVIGIYNESGTLVAKYEYSAFGEIISVTDLNGSDIANINPFRYRGYYYDTETGFYYLQTRYYDPVVGRFLNADDVDYIGLDGSLLSYNPFIYCLNNPTNRFDAEGTWSMPNWLKVTVGAVALAGAVALTVATGGGAAAVAIGVAKIVGSVAVSTAVSAGIGYLEGGKQGAIDGACNGFMFGSLSACGGAAFKYAKVKNATTGTSNSMGKAGEKLAGIKKNKTSYTINGRSRIPDGITTKYVQEVKNVKRLSYTLQLKDSMQLAKDMGKTLELFIRPDTYLTAPLRKAIEQYGVKVTYLW